MLGVSNNVLVDSKYIEVRSKDDLNEYTIVKNNVAMEATEQRIQESAGNNGINGSGSDIDTKLNHSETENLQKLTVEEILSQDDLILMNDYEGKLFNTRNTSLFAYILC